MAADEGRRMREGNVVILRDRAFFTRGLDEGVEVVPDHFGHAGRRDGNHRGLIEVVGIGEPVDHIGQAAENRRVFRHR